MSRPLNICVVTKNAANCYHGTLVQSIHQTLPKLNANMFIINTFMINRFCKEQGNDPVYYKVALNNIDGWIILLDGASNQYYEMIYRTGKPIVNLGFKREGFKSAIVKEDSRCSAEEITQHLIEHGHKKIAYLGYFPIYDMVERFEGYKKALEDYGIPFDPNLVISSNSSMAPSGKAAVQEVLRNVHDFTAIFAANDFLALGAMEAIKEAGLRIPEDIAIIGYDNTTYAESANPSLSSVYQDLITLGSTAAEVLVKAIIEKKLPDKDTLVKSKLILRNSCGCKVQQADKEEYYKDGDSFKNMMFKYMEESIGRNYDIATELMSTNINEIKNLLPKIAKDSLIQCTGFWDGIQGMEKKLYIQQVVDVNSKTVLNPNILCPIEDFPPEEFIPYAKNSCIEDIVWILPVSTAARDWFIIAYVAPFNKIDALFAYDSSIVLFNLLGTFLEHEISNMELRNTLETLNKTLETLQQTQEQLIQSEKAKMVSLEGLVVGVAHEINTPIGVSITAASFIQECSQKSMELFQLEKLKRSDLLKYFEISAESTNILLMNLNKASDLVKSFKEIAVDQYTEEKRSFKVKGYINDVMLGLGTKLRKTRIVVEFDCSEELEMYSYPSGLSQILTNLVINSIIHAYNEDEKGVISIKVSKEGSIFNFIYSDDGKGIDKNDLSKIFDPFFTTQRGTGRTGLGLNIVYNIVTQKFGGSIKCKSELGKGAEFIIKIPIIEI